jgi:very-short-patch-repair endonuclease
MPARNIVIGQRVQPDKVQRAKELRRKMTPTENILWQKLRANRLGGYHFRRQQVIAGFIVDFYCHAVGLIVEVDGGIHQTRTEYDQERDRILSARGLRIIRIPNADISRDLPSALNRILNACQETTS